MGNSDVISPIGRTPIGTCPKSSASTTRPARRGSSDELTFHRPLLRVSQRLSPFPLPSISASLSPSKQLSQHSSRCLPSDHFHREERSGEVPAVRERYGCRSQDDS